MMYSELALKGPTPAYAHDVNFLEYLKLYLLVRMS